MDAAPPTIGRRRRWRWVAIGGLAVVGAAAVAAVVATRPDPEPLFCTADGLIQTDLGWHRDGDKGCCWVDAADNLMRIDANCDADAARG